MIFPVFSKTHGTQFVELDAADLHLVERHTWGVRKESHTTYVATERNGEVVRLHNVVLGQKLVDHINHDGLDNRKSNLRPCTKSQNSANSRLAKNNTSGFKGVSRRKDCQRWVANIMVNRKLICLGYFPTAEAAAAAYDSAAIQHFGEFAYLNWSKP